MMNKSHAIFPMQGLIIWVLAALFFLYEFFLRTFIGSLAHQIIPQLHLNAESFALMNSGYYMLYGIMQIPVGILLDRFGVKWIMIFGLSICVIATSLFSYSNSLFPAFVDRCLMGFGSSFAFICLLVVTYTWLPKKYFGLFSGISQFIGTIGPMLAGGPLIAYTIDLHETWRMALRDVAIFGILLTLLVMLFVRSASDQQRDISSNPQQTIPQRFNLLRLLRNFQAWAIALYSGSLYVSIALLGAIWGTDYLQSRGLSQVAAANIISCAWLGYAIGCPVLSGVSDFVQRRKPILLFCSLIGFFATVGITYFSFAHADWIYGILFFSVGMAASGQNLGFALMSEQTDAKTRAAGLGLNNGMISVFVVGVPLLASYLIQVSAYAEHAHILQSHNFMVGFMCMPVLYLASFLIAYFLIQETYCRSKCL